MLQYQPKWLANNSTFLSIQKLIIIFKPNNINMYILKCKKVNIQRLYNNYIILQFLKIKVYKYSLNFFKL